MADTHIHYVRGGKTGQMVIWECSGSCSWRADAPRRVICSGGCEIGVRLLGAGGGE